MPIYFGQNGNKMVKGILVVNILVFLAWQAFALRDYSFLAENFLVSWSLLEEGRFWTLVTSVFSHISFLHIFLNMFVLFSFGSLMEQVMGSYRFLLFYLMAGIVASLSHALVSLILMGDPDLPALGASGAIAGVVLLFSCLFPRQKILIFGIIPVPALWGAVGFVALDLWGMMQQVRGHGLPIGYGAHLGGAFAGIVYYFFFQRKNQRNSMHRYWV